jgi:hypothetical protein
LRLRTVNDVGDELLERDPPALGFRRGLVRTLHGESPPRPQCFAVARFHDFDVDRENHDALGDFRLTLSRAEGAWHVRVVAGHPAAHDSVRRGFAGEPQAQTIFDGFANGVIDVARQRRLGGEIVERENGNRFDVGTEAAAREAIGAGSSDQRERANRADARDPEENRQPYRCQPR